MLIFRRALSAVLVLAFSALLTAAKHNFQTGKLISIDSEEKLFQGTSYRFAVISVEVGGVVYSARGDRERRHSGDPGHGLIIGDPVKASIDGETLILIRPDGKELKAKIVKRERAH